MPSRKCKQCKTSHDPLNMIRVGISLVCSQPCRAAENLALFDKQQIKQTKDREKQIKKQQRQVKEDGKAFRRETRKRKTAAKTKSEWAKEAQTAVNRYVRLRDSGQGCISCDKPASWGGQWHASHFYSRGHSSGLRFNLWNIHKSCSICNAHLSGNIGEYRPRLIAKIGKPQYDWLLEHKSDLADHSEAYLQRIKRIFNAKCKMLERRVFV